MFKGFDNPPINVAQEAYPMSILCPYEIRARIPFASLRQLNINTANILNYFSLGQLLVI
jgi:hypothetical protein